MLAHIGLGETLYRALAGPTGLYFYGSAVINVHLQPPLLVSCNDRTGVDYATTLTQALLQVLASYSMQCFLPLPRLNSYFHAASVPFPSHG